jgi:probable addiction module antidote protein
METHSMSHAKAFDPQKYRNNPTMISEYLNRSLATDDLTTVLAALAAMVKAQNVLALSEGSAIRRETFYIALRENKDPKLARDDFENFVVLRCGLSCGASKPRVASRRLRPISMVPMSGNV